MSFATSSFAGVQVTKAAAAPKASGRTARLVVEARRTKASAPAKSAAKVRHGKKAAAPNQIRRLEAIAVAERRLLDPD